MTPEQATALIGAVTGLLVAVAVLFREMQGIRSQLRENHRLINGRLSQLVDSTRESAYARGQKTPIGDDPGPGRPGPRS